MEKMAVRRENIRPGVTLIELLLGVLLFSMVLELAVSALNTSHRSLAVANRQIPVEVTLQNAMDDATRLIRQASDVTGGGTSITLTQRGGETPALSFTKPALFFGTTVLQTGLDSANFEVKEGALANTKYVVVTLGTSPHDGTPYRKTLVSSVALRDYVAAAPPPASSPPPASTPPPVALWPAPWEFFKGSVGRPLPVAIGPPGRRGDFGGSGGRDPIPVGPQPWDTPWSWKADSRWDTDGLTIFRFVNRNRTLYGEGALLVQTKVSGGSIVDQTNQIIYSWDEAQKLF